MSKSSKKDVGRGIRALLANIEKEGQKKQKPRSKKPHDPSTPDHDIPISSIDVNPFQPRSEFDEVSLAELADSIRIHGVIQPITVRRLNKNSYQLISGERRWRAAKLAGLKRIPAYIRKADDQGMLEISLIENIQRADLNPIEIALSYKRLQDECGLTHQKMSDRIGKKRSSITNYLRLLKLPPIVQRALKSGSISMGHAKVISGVEGIDNQISVLSEILKEGLSVRATERFVASRSASPSSPAKAVTKAHPEVQKMMDNLSDHLGRKVAISRNQKGAGSIKIVFKNDNELNDLVDTLLN